MLTRLYTLLRNTVSGFFADSCLSQGAAIAYYTMFSMAPVLIIVIGIAGLVFGHEATQGAVVAQLSGLMGQQSADALQTMIKGASNRGTGSLATSIGIATLIVAASGVFSQMQSALNTIWKAKPRTDVSRLVRARLASIGLVASLGFLLLVSLVVSAALSALNRYLNGIFPGAHLLLQAANFAISLVLIAALFAAIYKVLPDTPIAWRDVAVGSIGTALLFTIGKSLIGLFLAKSKVAEGFGAAGSFILILVWIYYSAQIFLLGAEFTRVYAESHGSRKQGRHTADP